MSLRLCLASSVALSMHSSMMLASFLAFAVFLWSTGISSVPRTSSRAILVDLAACSIKSAKDVGI